MQTKQTNTADLKVKCAIDSFYTDTFGVLVIYI